MEVRGRRGNFKVICLTGGKFITKKGPCGGKTSSVSILSDLFTNIGWKVYRVPETATVLFNAGVQFPELNEEAQYSFQKSILSVMLKVENSFFELAKINAENGINSIVICDRGAMDPSAYMPRSQWLQMLNELNLDEVQLRDSRYDVIVHLVTTAKGAEEYYTLENNTTRTEGMELARKLDQNTMEAWLGHASFQVIDNDCHNFDEKCNNVVRAIATRLGIKSNSAGKNIRKQKYIVKNSSAFDNLPIPYKEFTVEHRYLLNTQQMGVQRRIRKRVECGSSTNHHTLTQRYVETPTTKRIETRRILSPLEYLELLDQVDSTRKPIIKNRKCFFYADNYFQLDQFQQPHNGLVLLETYTTENGTCELPPWLILEEVTHASEYSMYNLSRSDPAKTAKRSNTLFGCFCNSIRT